MHHIHDRCEIGVRETGASHFLPCLHEPVACMLESIPFVLDSSRRH